MSPTLSTIEIQPRFDKYGKLCFDPATAGLVVEGDVWTLSLPEGMLKARIVCKPLPSGAQRYKVAPVPGTQADEKDLTAASGFSCDVVDDMILHFDSVEGTARKRVKSASIQVLTPGKD